MNNEFETTYTTEAPRKKKKLHAVAAALAVAIIGGASGFGGAYLAGSALAVNTQTDDTSVPNVTEEKESVIIPDDISSAIGALNSAEGNTAVNNSGNSGTVTPTGPNGAYTAEELFEAVDDSIVFVKLYQNTSSNGYYDYFFGYDSTPEEDSEPVYAGSGSGIVFTEDGYILTNAHVVEDAVKVEVVVNDYNDKDNSFTYEAEVIGSDASADVAVIKITRDEPFKAAKIGDSDTLRVGQDVCAIGNPGYNTVIFEHTMTKGIVSGLNRYNLSTGYTTSLIQIDAAINSGNSGGALFDMYGNVVGIVNKKIKLDSYEGLGFAITINEAKPVLEDLLSFGYVKNRPVLGITTSALNEMRAQLYGLKLTKGLLVTAIREDAAANKSDLRVSDIITKINGTNVETVEDVQTIIKDMKAGDIITVTVARENEDGTLDSVEFELELSENKRQE